MALVGAGIVGGAGQAAAATYIRDLVWSQQDLDARDGQATNTLTFTVGDGAPGWVSVGMAVPETVSVAAHYGDSVDKDIVLVERAHGWATYRFTFKVPSVGYAVDTVWQVTGVGANLLRPGLDYDFTARATPDTTGPVHSGVTIDRQYHYVGEGAGAPVYTVSATDRETGITRASVTLTGPGGAMASGTKQGRLSALAASWPRAAAKVAVPVPMPPGAPAGVWRVTSVTLVDGAGNVAIHDVDTAPITVTANTDIRLSDIAVTPNPVQTWLGDTDAELTASIDSPAGVTRAEFSVNGPCVAGAQTLPAGEEGVLAIVIRVPADTTHCGNMRLRVFDDAGHVSLFGGPGEPPLPTIDKLVGPAPTLTAVQVSHTAVDWNKTTRVEVTLDVASWKPGVTWVSAEALLRGLPAGSGSRSLPRVLSGRVVIPLDISPPKVSGGPITIRVQLRDAAGVEASDGPYPGGGRPEIAVRIPAGASGYYSVNPTRALDTRTTGGPLGPGGTRALALPGLPGDATAAVLNLTATAPTAASYLTAWADGRARPTASSVNFVPGQTVANLVTVPVVDGRVRIFNHVGSVHVVADLFGYYRPGIGSTYLPSVPNRVFDTREYADAIPTKMKSGSTRGFHLRSEAEDVTAALLNVTATETTAPGHLTFWQMYRAKPATSNINFPSRWTGSNQALVPLGGFTFPLSVYNQGGGHVVVDEIGVFTTRTDGQLFVPAGPRRIMDTRTGAKIGPRATRQLAVPGLPANAKTVVLNLTATEPTAHTYVTAWAYGAARPGTSNLNVAPRATTPIQVTVPVVGGKVQLYNNAGSTHLVADLLGYYVR